MNPNPEDATSRSVKLSHTRHASLLCAEVHPSGVTRVGARVEDIAGPYLREYEAADERRGIMKPLNIVVLIGSVPSGDLGGVIAGIARRLDELKAPPRQVGIQLIQIGRNADVARALGMLELEICVGKYGTIRNIIDVAAWDDEGGADGERAVTADKILTVMLTAVMRRCCQRRRATYRESPQLSKLASNWLRTKRAWPTLERPTAHNTEAAVSYIWKR